MKAQLLKIFPFVFFFFFATILFRPYLFKGLVPVPGDILIGHYYPWKDEIWDGRTAGYPVKNFILFDGIRQTLPWRLLAIEQMQSGQWPLWNPYILLGMPLLGNIQAAAFYPLNFLFLILPKLDAWSIYVFLQPVLAGLFAYFFVRTIDGSKIASLLSGTCYGFSLIMMNHLEFGIDGHTALWLPLALGSINNFLFKRGQWRWLFLLTTAVLMTLLGGYPPPAIYNLMIIFFYVCYKTKPFLSRKIIFIFGGIFLAFLLSAPQTLPALELTKKIVREESQFGVISDEAYFFPRENLLMLLAPDFFGHPATNNFFSKINYTDNPSIGVIGLVFVVYSLFFAFRNKEVKFWTFFAIFPLLLMLETPVGKLLREINISFISLVTPIRMIWIVAFSLSVLTGTGIDKARELISEIAVKGKYIIRNLSPVIIIWEILLFTIIASFLFLEGPHREIAQRNLVLPAVFLTATFLLIGLAVIFPKKSGTILFLMVLLSGIELTRQGIKYNPFIKKELVFPPVTILKKVQESETYWRSLVTHPELIPVNSNTAYHLPMVDGYASISDSRSGQLIKLANQSYPVEEIKGFPRVVFQTEYNSPITDLLGVKYVFSLDKELANPKLNLIAEVGKTKLYENQKVFPRVLLFNQYYVESNDLKIANLMLKIDLKKEVVLEKMPVILPKNSVEGPTGKAQISEYQDNKIEIRTSSSEPAILLLTDSYYPDWKVKIDGISGRVVRADYNLRAVAVPTGEHKIIFEFRPKTFFAGLGIFVISFLFLIIFSFWVYIKKIAPFQNKKGVIY